MPLQSTRSRKDILRGAALAAIVSLCPLPGDDARAEGPFAGLAGSWTGAGTITVSGGARERIRCRASYSVGNAGASFRQDLRCASDSYNFVVSANVTYQGGELSGTWSESTRGVSGGVRGRASPGSIQATVSGLAFSASLSVTTHGRSQSVTIRPHGTDVTGVSITMSRR